MRHFLYLDTDIVNSIIAQQGEGLIDAITTENEKGTDINNSRGVKAEGSGEAEAKVWKLANADVKLGLSGTIEGSNSKHEATREIIAKTLHDAAFDMAYDAMKPVVINPGKDDGDPGIYVEMTRIFDFVDLEYLEGLFSKDGIVELIKKNEKEKICEATKEYKETNLNRAQRRQGGKKLDSKKDDILKQLDTRYDGIKEIIAAMRKIIPFGKMLVSSDGYLIPTDDKYFRVNPSTIGFMYGGEIKCVGMITNIIGKDTNPNDKDNLFATLQFSVNEALRQILPTEEDNLYVISPIAIYYEN